MLVLARTCLPEAVRQSRDSRAGVRRGQLSPAWQAHSLALPLALALAILRVGYGTVLGGYHGTMVPWYHGAIDIIVSKAGALRRPCASTHDMCATRWRRTQQHTCARGPRARARARGRRQRTHAPSDGWKML